MSARAVVALLVAAGLAAPAGAQSLAPRIAGAGEGTVRLSFAAREGVCGNGRNIIHNTRHYSDRDRWEHECEAGPVRVALDVERGRVTAVRTYVGGRWREGGPRFTDLGMVAAPEAVGFFLDLAASGRTVRGDPITPAILADSVTVWPRLLQIARNTSVPRDIRKQAVFWVSQEAGEAATRGLSDLAEDEREDQDVRKQAVFALSQLDDDRGVPELIRIAQTNRDPVIRKQAIFWLGQSEDPRALALFESLLTRAP